MWQINVSGMSCGGCARRVTKAIQSVDPAAIVEVDLAAGTVRVRSNAAPEVLMQKISDAGYQVLNQAEVAT